MKQRTKIHCKILKDGTLTIINVVGAGSHCRDVTMPLEKAFGIVDEKSREVTADMYQDVDPLELSNEV